MQQTNLFNQNSYPIDFKFKVGTIQNDFTATDAMGNRLAYVKQKMFKLKEHVEVFEDNTQNNLKFDIRADRWLDFSACYTFYRKDSTPFGKLLRKGWKSLWKASYDIYDEKNNPDLHIKEANPFAKVFDTLLSEIPILGIFTGYVFNPEYHITRPDGTLVFKLKKQASFFGRKFKLTNEALVEPGEEERILVGLMMMLLLERRRG
jgi:hypothetical protein